MVDYEKDVEDEAKGFLADYEDMIKQAIKEGKDFDRNDIDDLDTAFHENITDRAYSPEDAVFILEHCENEETDSGLWEGSDWRDELSARASYSFSNDVWFKCEEIYKQIKEEYESHLATPDTEEEELPEEELPEEEQNKLLDRLFEEHTSTKLEPVEKGSQEEKELIERWLRLNENAGLWGGYPVGSSYIDARCGSGHGMPDVKDYVDFDRELAQRCPHLADKRKEAVKEYYEKTFCVKQPQ